MQEGELEMCLYQEINNQLETICYKLHSTVS